MHRHSTYTQRRENASFAMRPHASYRADARSGYSWSNMMVQRFSNLLLNGNVRGSGVFGCRLSNVTCNVQRWTDKERRNNRVSAGEISPAKITYHHDRSILFANAFVMSYFRAARSRKQAVIMHAYTNAEDEEPPEQGMLEEDEVDSDEELEGESFEDVTILSNEEEQPLEWDDYMNMNIDFLTPEEIVSMDPELAPSEGESEVKVSTRQHGEASALLDKSEIIRDKYGPLTESNEGKEWPWIDIAQDPLLAGSSAARFFGGKRLKVRPTQHGVTEWDLRAKMEKKKRMEREYKAWIEKKEARIGRYQFQASDWRSDARVYDTGDPNDPEYREWTMKEIWELIILGGRSADPRDVPHEVFQPGSRPDIVAEGFVQQPEIPDWLEMHGKLIADEEEADIVDQAAESVLMASEFSDFEEDFDATSDSMDDGSF